MASNEESRPLLNQNTSTTFQPPQYTTPRGYHLIL